MPKVSQKNSPFQEILQNRTDGASALFYRFVEIAADQTNEIVVAGLEACRATFPLMAVWRHALDQFRQGEYTLDNIATQFRRQTQDTVNTGAFALAEFQTILTLSNSSVVRQAITSAVTPKVLCAESLPGAEGINQVKALNESGIQAALVKDSDVRESMPQVQAIALGADQWDLREFMNKVGSKKLVEYAELGEIPVFILAERFKQEDQIPSANSSASQLGHLAKGNTTQETLFETITWKPHIRLITNTEILFPSTL